MPVIHCRVRRDEHNGEDQFCETARRDRLVWICEVSYRDANGELIWFGLAVPPFDWCRL
jgi:hypothetical protein